MAANCTDCGNPTTDPKFDLCPACFKKTRGARGAGGKKDGPKGPPKCQICGERPKLDGKPVCFSCTGPYISFGEPVLIGSATKLYRVTGMTLVDGVPAHIEGLEYITDLQPDPIAVPGYDAGKTAFTISVPDGAKSVRLLATGLRQNAELKFQKPLVAKELTIVLGEAALIGETGKQRYLISGTTLEKGQPAHIADLQYITGKSAVPSAITGYNPNDIAFTFDLPADAKFVRLLASGLLQKVEVELPHVHVRMSDKLAAERVKPDEAVSKTPNNWLGWAIKFVTGAK